MVGASRDDRENQAPDAVESEDIARGVSKRRPSATLAFVLMTQLQFLATLSLVDSTVNSDTWLSDFLIGLR